MQATRGSASWTTTLTLAQAIEWKSFEQHLSSVHDDFLALAQAIERKNFGLEERQRHPGSATLGDNYMVSYVDNYSVSEVDSGGERSRAT